jgi:hypothetical protein
MTLKDAAAGVAVKPPADGPAVTVREPDARTLAALTGAAAALAPSAPAAPLAAAPAAPAVAQAATPAPAPAATAAQAADPEAEANTMLQFAESYLRANMKIKAILKYEELVKKYPQTAAGKTAKAKLEALGE